MGFLGYPWTICVVCPFFSSSFLSNSFTHQALLFFRPPTQSPINLIVWAEPFLLPLSATASESTRVFFLLLLLCSHLKSRETVCTHGRPCLLVAPESAIVIQDL